jgi:AbrB family looped-hinge helix DNA binding protein
MTSKGQIVVPKEVRDSLGLATGSKVAFVESSEGEWSIRPARRSIKDVKGMLERPGRPPVSLEEMDAAIAAGAAGRQA